MIDFTLADIIGGEPVEDVALASGAAKELCPIPIGFIREVFYAVVDTSGPGLTHDLPSKAAIRREIWNGSKFIDFDSPDGLKLFNEIAAKIAKDR